MKRYQVSWRSHVTSFMRVVLPLLILVHFSQGSALAGGLESIVANVDTLFAGGGAGPVMGLNENVFTIVAGDPVTATFPSIAAVASTSGSGRAIGLCQEAFFGDHRIEMFDNLQFAKNAISWLDRFHRKRVLIVTGHQEWSGNNTTILQSRLIELGYTVTLSNGALTEAKLQDVGVVYAGNIWGSITAQEMTAIQAYYNGGGGLLLMGAGWSWTSSNPGLTLDDYPMNQLGALCGIRWIDGMIFDDVHKFLDYPLFLHFYPESWMSLQTVPNAMSYINSSTGAHATDLPSALQSDVTFRTEYAMAHSVIAWGLMAGVPSYPRQIYDFYTTLVTSYPQFFRKGFAYDRSTESAVIFIRERIHRTLADALPLTPAIKMEIAATLNFTGRYRDIWNSFSILLLDNSTLDAVQLEFIYQYLTSLPPGLHNLRAISVGDFLGSTSPPVSLNGGAGSVNIFGIGVGAWGENSFPPDVSPVYVDVFCVVVAHEVNHVVDNYTIQYSAPLANRRKAVLLAAGTDSLNYLRSMSDHLFFTNNPQEFIAAIANEWFTDSWQTMRLGLVRFAGGRPQPLNQAIFFADVYSKGADSTYFYRIDQAGHLSRETIPLTRDQRGHINGIQFDGLWHTFTLDTDGNVLNTAVPIQLASFEVQKCGTDAMRLTWSTASEINNYGFEVQRSSDGISFASIAGSFVPGNGTTILAHTYAYVDANPAGTVGYRLKQTDLDGTVHYSEPVQLATATDVKEQKPAVFGLYQNYPNPFNPISYIEYQIAESGHVRLSVFDLLGREVAVLVDENKTLGTYRVEFDASHLASGAYYYRMAAGTFVQTRKMLLVR